LFFDFRSHAEAVEGTARVTSRRERLLWRELESSFWNIFLWKNSVNYFFYI